MTHDQLRWTGMNPADLRAPLVGRADDLADLSAAAAAVLESRTARIMTILGPAGVGKSRLVYELFAQLPDHDEGETLRVYRASAAEGGSAYGVFARLLRSRFGLVDGMDPEATKALVRAQVASVLEDRKVGDVLYFLGQLLGVSFPDSPLTKAVTDEPLQARLLRRAVLRRLVESDATQSPMALVFDDLQDATDDSIELLSYLLANVTAPVLFVCLAKNELLHRHDTFLQMGGDRHRSIDLGPLGEREARTVMEALLAPSGEPPVQLVDAGCDLAGGNPMLLERMVRVFQDTGVLEVLTTDGQEPTWRVDLQKLETVQLPMTVEDAVEARIAALAPDERRILEKGTAMGSVFWLGGLVSLERMDGPAPELWTATPDATRERLRAMLTDLIERDYILQLPDGTFGGEEEYVFKHNKERERLAQYTSAGDLRRYHGVLAEWLEHKTQVSSHEEHMGMLARHREQAGQIPRAAMAFLSAGDVARERYANQKSAEYYQRGLELLGDSDLGRRVDALHHLGDVLQTLGRQEEALTQFREMKTLAYRLDLVAKGGAAHNRIGRLFRSTGKLEDASKHLETGLQLFHAAGDERGIASSLDDIGKVHWMRGDYPKALEEMRRGLLMRRRLGDRRGIALSLSNLGLVLQDSGQYKEASEALDQSLSIRREIGDLLGVVTSLNNLGTLSQDQHDHERALSLFQEAFAVAKEIGDRNRLSLVLTNIGETHYRLGQIEEAIRILKQAEELCDELGDKLGLAEAVRGLGKAYLLQNDLPKARACITRAVDLFTAVRSKVHLGIALRTLGEVTAAGGWGVDHTAKAGDYFRRAIAIFHEVGNEIELARAYRAFAMFLYAAPGGEAGEAARKEASQMEMRAEEIFGRLNVRVGPSGAWRVNYGSVT